MNDGDNKEGVKNRAEKESSEDISQHEQRSVCSG